MSYRIEYIQTFYTDVHSILLFLAEYPNKAARIFAKADKSISNLEEMPEMYPVYIDVPSFRVIVIEDYLEVHRLLYGGMEIPERVQ